MTAQLDVDQARAEAQLRHDLRAADRAAAEQSRADRRAEKHQAAEQRRTWRRDRRQQRRAALAELGRRLRPAAPIALVTALAMYGQVAYAFAEIAPPWWIWPLRIVLALAIGIAFESISLTVQWHAHDSLLRGHTLTAARQRRVSYLLAIGGGVVNYSHFAGPAWSPTPAAVCFFAFSAAGPWLWGLHTRRAHQVQLSREGQLDTGGAVFSAERYRWFPWRTFGALRWSIDHNVVDPQVAWEGFNAEKRERKVIKAAERAAARGARPSGADRRPSRFRLRRPVSGCATNDAAVTASVPVEPAPAVAVTVDGIDWPLRKHIVATDRDPAIAADLKAMERKFQRRPGRDTVMAMYGIGVGRADRILGPRGLGWMPKARTDQPDRQTDKV